MLNGITYICMHMNDMAGNIHEFRWFHWDFNLILFRVFFSLNSCDKCITPIAYGHEIHVCVCGKSNEGELFIISRMPVTEMRFPRLLCFCGNRQPRSCQTCFRSCMNKISNDLICFINFVVLSMRIYNWIRAIKMIQLVECIKWKSHSERFYLTLGLCISSIRYFSGSLLYTRYGCIFSFRWFAFRGLNGWFWYGKLLLTNEYEFTSKRCHSHCSYGCCLLAKPLCHVTS